MQTRPSNRITGSPRRARESITRNPMTRTPNLLLVLPFSARREPGQRGAHAHHYLETSSKVVESRYVAHCCRNDTTPAPAICSVNLIHMAVGAMPTLSASPCESAQTTLRLKS